MSYSPALPTFNFDHALRTERARLVRLCAYFSGDSRAAEDLAQETMLEAWRHADRLRDPSGYSAWLAAIARNVCLRHRRALGKENTIPETPELDSADTFDLEIELDRHELSTLLDRALSQLPPEMRGVLIAKYIDDTPLAEIAERMGSSPGTVAVRLHRGKLALKRILRTDFQADAESYGLITTTPDAWTTTNIWCPYCGKERMTGQMERESGTLDLRCPNCAPDSAQSLYIRLPHLFDAVKGYKPALTRHLNFSDQMYADAISGTCLCMSCGGPARLVRTLPDDPATASIQIWCEHCGLVCHASIRGLALASQPGQAFWRKHPRMSLKNIQAIEHAGRTALLTTFAAHTTDAQFQAAFDAETFRFLFAHS